jgi:hypothetical protein
VIGNSGFVHVEISCRPIPASNISHDVLMAVCSSHEDQKRQGMFAGDAPPVLAFILKAEKPIPTRDIQISRA